MILAERSATRCEGILNFLRHFPTLNSGGNLVLRNFRSEVTKSRRALGKTDDLIQYGLLLRLEHNGLRLRQH